MPEHKKAVIPPETQTEQLEDFYFKASDIAKKLGIVKPIYGKHGSRRVATIYFGDHKYQVSQAVDGGVQPVKICECREKPTEQADEHDTPVYGGLMESVELASLSVNPTESSIKGETFDPQKDYQGEFEDLGKILSLWDDLLAFLARTPAKLQEAVA